MNPSVAGQALARVRAPTLLIVGGKDFQVIQLNEVALALLHCEKRELVIVPEQRICSKSPERKNTADHEPALGNAVRCHHSFHQARTFSGPLCEVGLLP
jgi:hypothetical protein